MHNQIIPQRSWLFGSVLVIFFQIWLVHLSLGLQKESEISGHAKYVLDQPSWMESGYSDIYARDKSGSDLWDIVEPSGKKLKRGSDQVDEGLGEINHENVHPKSSTSGNRIANSNPQMEHITYGESYGIKQGSLDLDHIPKSLIRSMETERSGHSASASGYLESSFLDSHLGEESFSNLWDVAQPPSQILNQILDQVDEWLGETNHENIHLQSSAHPTDMRNQNEFMEDITYTDPYTTYRHLQDGNHIPNPIIDTHWDHVNTLPPHNICNPIRPDYYGAPLQVNRDLTHLENQSRYDKIPASYFPLNSPNHNMHNLPNQNQASTIGLNKQEQVLARSYMYTSPSNTLQDYQLSLVEHHVPSRAQGVGSHKGSDVKYNVLPPNSPDSGRSHQHITFEDLEPDSILRQEIPAQGELAEPESEGLNESIPEEITKYFPGVMYNKGTTILDRLNMEVPAILNAEVIDSRGVNLHHSQQDESDSQDWHTEQLLRNLNVDKHLEESPKPKKNSRSSSKVTISASQNNHLGLLQKIGVLNVNRSPTLCYEIYDFFVEMCRDMVSRFPDNSQAIEASRQVVKNAGYGVVMGFLGVLRVFEGEKSDEKDLEVLFNDGWTYLQGKFETWRTAEAGDFRLGEKTKFDPELASDFKFHLKYLKRIENPAWIAVSLVHSLCLDWAEDRKRSKIPRRSHFPYLIRIHKTYTTDLFAIKGGLYSRMEIRNHAFWGPEQFSRRQWSPFKETDKELENPLVLSSIAAQFHTPIGRDMCLVVHRFFEELIQDLQSSYREINGYNLLQDLPAQAHQHLDMIINHVSLAEYRVTVVIIGAIRLLNQSQLNGYQLQRLLMNSWNFLKGEFSKWKSLQFDRKTLDYLFNPNLVRIYKSQQFQDPATVFRSLSGFKRQSVFPKLCIYHLLKLWRKSISEIKPGSENYLGFQVANIPEGKIGGWKLTL
ncbi:hypothetical protein DFH28DRAFT_970002 [Melampsora americana]|nr:hypothetical protein DFH28DRAFT_970002 [Melampsora americana]